MAPASSTVDKARRLIEERLAEIDDERKRLEGALKGLGGRSGGKRGPGRPRGSSGKRRRKRKGGTRGEQAVKLITGSPGITPSEIAKQLGIKVNYLYRVMNELQKDGLVTKRGRGYFPAGGAPAEPGPEPEAAADPVPAAPERSEAS